MSTTMVCRWQKFLKSQRLKRPKIVLKRQNLEQKIDNSKSHIRSLSLNFGFFRRKSESQQKLAKAITHFTVHFRSKSLAHFTNLHSLNIVKIILLQHSKNPYSLHKFSSKHVFGYLIFSEKTFEPCCF